MLSDDTWCTVSVQIYPNSVQWGWDQGLGNLGSSTPTLAKPKSLGTFPRAKGHRHAETGLSLLIHWYTIHSVLITLLLGKTQVWVSFTHKTLLFRSLDVNTTQVSAEQFTEKLKRSVFSDDFLVLKHFMLQLYLCYKETEKQ